MEVLLAANWSWAACRDAAELEKILDLCEDSTTSSTKAVFSRLHGMNLRWYFIVQDLVGSCKIVDLTSGIVQEDPLHPYRFGKYAA